MSKLVEYLPKMAKALVGGAAAAAGALASSASDGFTTGEIWAAVAAGLIALGAVWSIPNKPA
jgi:hypothetical protein